MINRLIEFSIKNPMNVFMMTFVLIGVGVYSFQSLPIDAVPDITDVQVQINSRVPALAPETTENTITYPIEISMNTIPNVKGVRSITRFGLSQVTVIFDEGMDIYLARQLVSEKLQTIELPEGVTPEMGPISTGLGEIVHYTLKAKKPETDPKQRKIQLMKLRTIQDWDVIPRLLTVRGVAEVNTIGGYPEQYYVKPSPVKLVYYGIHFDQIVEAIAQNQNTGGGTIEQTSSQLIVQGSGILKTVEDIENIVIKQLENFETIRVGDVAKVELDENIRTGAATCNGKECVVGTVFMLLGENSRSVSRDSAKRLAEIKSSLPDWVDIEIMYNRSSLVDGTLATVEKNLGFGALLVVVILFLLVGNIRVAVITALTIPLAMLSMLILMRISGVSGNLMSLGALDFGVIIDGAVIVMDNIARVVSQKIKDMKRPLTRTEVRDTVLASTKQIRQSAGFGQLIIVIVFLPLLGLTGVEGKMFRPMAQTFSFALASAFVLSFSVIPALAGTFLSGNMKTTEPWLTRKIKAMYEPLRDLVFKFQITALAFSGVLLIAGLALFATLGSVFIPQLYEGAIAVQLIRPENINVSQSVRMGELTEDVANQFTEVDVVFSRIGTSEISTDPMGVNISDTFVMLKNKSEWPRIKGSRRTPAELAETIKKQIQLEVPGQRVLVTQPIQMRFNELLEGIRADVSLKIFGKDLETLDQLGQQAAQILKSMPDSGDVESELQGKSPILDIVPKQEMLASMGIRKSNLLETVEIALAGKKANYLYQNSIRLPIYARLSREKRANLNTISNLPVPIANDATMPLRMLADIQIVGQYTTIKRENSQRRVAIMINPKGQDTEGFVIKAHQLLKSKLKLPTGYYMEWGGNFKNLQTARTRLMILAPMALLLVFIMTFAAFKRMLPTLLVFAAIPFAMVGGVINLVIMGLPFSISAGVGFIALLGIAVLNALVLISFLNQLKAEGMTGKELIQQGTMIRIRAILMTALAAALGFLPMMLATGLGAEVQRPIATVVVGGVITSTFMSLFLLPLLYSMLENHIDVAEDAKSH